MAGRKQFQANFAAALSAMTNIEKKSRNEDRSHPSLPSVDKIVVLPYVIVERVRGAGAPGWFGAPVSRGALPRLGLRGLGAVRRGMIAMAIGHLHRCRAVERPAAGFSVVELLVVIVIVSVLSGMGLLSYVGLKERNEPRAASKMVTSTLAGARQAAITANGRYQVFFNFTTNQLWVDEVDVLGGVLRAQVSVPLQLPRFMSVQSMEIDGAEQTDDTAAIIFWPDGHSDSATIVLARNVGDTSQSITIRVFGPTGTARTTP